MRTLYVSPTAKRGRCRRRPAVLEVGPLLRELILHILGIGMLDPADGPIMGGWPACWPT